MSVQPSSRLLGVFHSPKRGGIVKLYEHGDPSKVWSQLNNDELKEEPRLFYSRQLKYSNWNTEL